jgi:hypothetical protein
MPSTNNESLAARRVVNDIQNPTSADKKDAKLAGKRPRDERGSGSGMRKKEARYEGFGGGYGGGFGGGMDVF